MLNVLKKLFKQKERIGITLDNLEEWFDQKTKPFYETNEHNIDSIKTKTKEEIEKTKENLQILKEAQLRNKKITTREVQFMEGAREFYIKRITQFINNITDNEESSPSFIDEILTNINDFGKATLKSYNILQHFFKDEVYKLAQNIKVIENNIKSLKQEFESEKIKNIEEIKNIIKIFRENTSKKEEIKAKIIEIEKKQEELEKEKKDILVETSNKEQSQEFKEYHRLNVEEFKINEQIDELKNEIIQYFSTLDHALKKYVKLHPEDEEFLNKYIEEPLKAMVDDYELKIKKVLEKVKERIHDKKIELKDKKKEKTLHVLDKINEAKLASFLTEYNQLMVDLRNTQERVKQHDIMDVIEDIKIKLKKKKQDIESIITQITSLKEKLANIDLPKEKETIKQKISEFLNIEFDLD
jgi:hypothetical protein|tara:strand:- start:3070 stop:4308 length:1239 start_codon:yes stop_codon:yes gene_type:complete